MSAIYLPTIADGTKEHQSIYDYDLQHRLTSITHQICTVSTGHSCSSSTPTGSDAYEYDDSDNRKRVTENNGSASSDYRYCHDARNQLTGRGSTAACDTSSIETFAYDDPGNRTQAVEGGVMRNFAYTAEGLLCDQEAGAAASCTGGNVISDDAGRISDQAGWHYLYDAKARLVSACKSSSCSGSGFDRVDFEYDGEGHRTKITTTPSSGASVVTSFRYQGDAIAAEYKAGTLVREYTVDSSGTFSKVTIPAGQSGTGTYLVTWNGHGDALALYRIESSGSLTLANSYSYGTWGKPTTATHNGVADLGFRFLYVGAAEVQWDSAFGLDVLYMHARHYSPALGRFLEPDPARATVFAFAYAGNSPVSAIDPSGLTTVAVRFPTYDIRARADAYFAGTHYGSAVLHSSKAQYTGLSASPSRFRKLRFTINIKRVDWSGSVGVPGNGQLDVYAYFALVDVTAGKRLSTVQILHMRQWCVFDIFFQLCNPQDFSDEASGSFSATVGCSCYGKIVHNHYYRIDYWIVAIASVAFGSATAKIHSSGHSGSISW